MLRLWNGRQEGCLGVITHVVSLSENMSGLRGKSHWSMFPEGSLGYWGSKQLVVKDKGQVRLLGQRQRADGQAGRVTSEI